VERGKGPTTVNLYPIGLRLARRNLWPVFWRFTHAGKSSAFHLPSYALGRVNTI
jgi:hypothetical protein